MMTMIMMATAYLYRYDVHGENEIERRAGLTRNTQADPFLLPRGPSAVNGLTNMNVAGFEMCVCFLSLLLNVLDQRFLLHDNGIEVLEELLQLNHCALDLLDRVVALLDVAQRALRLSPAVGVEEGLLEDLSVAAIHRGFPDLRLRRFRVDDQVLPTLLLLHLLPELTLLRLVRIDRLPYPPIQRVDLRLVARLAGIRLRLDALHAIRESAVARHDIRAHAVDLLVARAVAGNEAALDALQVLQARLEVVDRTADGAALVEDGIGVAWGRSAGL